MSDSACLCLSGIVDTIVTQDRQSTIHSQTEKQLTKKGGEIRVEAVLSLACGVRACVGCGGGCEGVGWDVLVGKETVYQNEMNVDEGEGRETTQKESAQRKAPTVHSLPTHGQHAAGTHSG